MLWRPTVLRRRVCAAAADTRPGLGGMGHAVGDVALAAVEADGVLLDKPVQVLVAPVVIGADVGALEEAPVVLDGVGVDAFGCDVLADAVDDLVVVEAHRGERVVDGAAVGVGGRAGLGDHLHHGRRRGLVDSVSGHRGSGSDGLVDDSEHRSLARGVGSKGSGPAWRFLRACLLASLPSM